MKETYGIELGRVVNEGADSWRQNVCDKGKRPTGKDKMFKAQFSLIFAAAGLVAGCEDMTPTQRGAVTGAALGTGIGMVSGGSFG